MCPNLCQEPKTEGGPKFVSPLLLLDEPRGYEELCSWLSDVNLHNFTFAVLGEPTQSYWLENATRLSFIKGYGEIIPYVCKMPCFDASSRQLELASLIDTWTDKVGCSPKGFFDFQPDTYCLNYLDSRNVSYVVGYCFDQYSVDWMSMRGGWQLPYYASRKHALIPSDENYGGVVVLPHLTFDWASSFTVSHELTTHPLNLKHFLKNNMSQAEDYFYGLVQRTLEGCEPFGYVSVQFEWCWAGLDGNVRDYAKNWVKTLMRTHDDYKFWSCGAIADWFRSNYASTPSYRVNFVSPYDGQVIEWYYCKTFRVARSGTQVLSYVEFDKQESDTLVNSVAHVNFSDSTSPANSVDNSLVFSVDALGGGEYRAPVATGAVDYWGNLEDFPTSYKITQ